MVSRAQLDRLSARIDALAPRQEWRFATMFVHPGETEAQVRARHYREHPEDRSATQEIVVTFVAPKKADPAA
jgi:hypothetical protein